MDAQNIVGDNWIWEIHSKNNQSGIWEFLLNIRVEVLKCMDKRIMDGKTMSFWFDPWVQWGTWLISWI